MYQKIFYLRHMKIVPYYFDVCYILNVFLKSVTMGPKLKSFLKSHLNFWYAPSISQGNLKLPYFYLSKLQRNISWNQENLKSRIDIVKVTSPLWNKISNSYTKVFSHSFQGSHWQIPSKYKKPIKEEPSLKIIFFFKKSYFFAI